MTEQNEQLNKLRLELRRGVIVLAVLSQLKTPQYGYSLIQRLSDLGMDIEEGTLYPLLRRLDKQGLLNSDWEIGESRPRKYYRISEMGETILKLLTVDWDETVEVMNRLLNGHDDE